MKFNSFQELRSAVEGAREENMSQVDRVLDGIKDDLDSIPEGPLQSSLPELNWISFVHTINKEAGGRRGSGSVNAVLSVKTESGKNIIHTWSVSRNGINPIGKIPNELTKKYSKDEIALEIATLIETIKPASIHLTEFSFIPDKDPGREGVEGGGETVEESQDLIDPRRRMFLDSLKGGLFQAFNRKIGFNGYGATVFKDFLYLDNFRRGNAAFFIDLPEGIDPDAIREELLKAKAEMGENEEVTENELREEIIRRYWGPIYERAKTKEGLKALGAKRIPHSPRNWEEIILEEIKSRTEPSEE